MAKRRRKKRRLAPVLVILLLIVIVGIAGVISSWVKKYTPSDAKMDLTKYYKLNDAGESAVVLQDEVSETKGRIEDNVVYLPYSLVVGELGGRFYWDKETQAMLYTLPNEVLEIMPESSSYKKGGEEITEDYVIVHQIGEGYYIALDFLEQYMPITGKTYENPARTVIWYKWGNATMAEAGKDTPVRYQGGIKSPVLKEVKSGEHMLVLEELENWIRVMTEDGLDGYVYKKDLKGLKETEYVYNGKYKEEYTSLTRDHKINLAWHQVTSEAANGTVGETLKNITGVNVISPTWFSVTTNQGNISSLASQEYVKKAHEKGMEVWGLIDNFDENVSTLETLSSRSARTHIIEMLLSEAKRVGLDGINVDFEALTEEEAPHFLQFVRELSVVCRANNLVLSIDDPVPQYTAFYNRKEQGIMADYVIIMGYDEHTIGSLEAGSVASLPFVQEGIEATLKEVPKEKVINGVPFYTRLWTVGNNGNVTSVVCGMDDADKKVQELGMDMYWNKDVSQNYAEAVTDTGTLKIWLEDEKSLEAKMKLINEYELAGVAAWKLGFERSSVWEIISKYIQ